MKKMEFMRCAAKELMDFFSELFVENVYNNQVLNLKSHQGSFTLKNGGGFMNFYVYKTGTISYSCRSFTGTRGEYYEYYAYNAEDDHEKVLMKFRDDLRKLKPYFDDFFSRASFEWDAWQTVTFCYQDEFATTLELPCEDEEGL